MLTRQTIETMTRSSLARRLSSYALAGHSDAWSAPEVLGCFRLDCVEPSNNYYGWSSPASNCQVSLRRSSSTRRFCAWPTTASATAQASVTSPVPVHEGNGSAQWILDPASAAQSDRRLREFLYSRSVQDLPSTRQQSSTPSLPPQLVELPPQDSSPGHVNHPVLEQSLPPVGAFHGARDAATAISAAVATTYPTSFPSSATLAASARSSSQTQDAAPRTALSASAIRERARAALRDVPAFISSGSGGCDSRSNKSSPGGATALPEPQPHPQQPHPASPTPVDWREMLRKAVQVLGEREVVGRELLTDRFSRVHTYLRISLTERCNLRCTYCMPDEGVELTPQHHLLTTPEIMRLVRLFVEAGVTKVRLTGGEPTLRRDLSDLVQQLSALRPMGLRSISITSNGIVLGRQLPSLQEAGLTAVNISLDTLREERFEQLTRRPGHKRVLESIRTAVGLGYDPVKVNVVVMRGVNDDEVADFAALTLDEPINVRFIEYMPFDGNVWSDSKMVPYRELVSRIQAAFPNSPLERLDDPAGEVAKNFRLRHHRGSVSFVTSMTQHFCSDCNRLRLLADGNLKVCLFGASEVSLRDAMRGNASDQDIRAIIALAVRHKQRAHAGMFELAASANRPMITIGG